jgi:hypothetical protein
VCAREDPPEKSRDARFVDWAQRINGKYADVLRWVGLVGAVIFAALGRPELATLFGGFIAISLALGKRE